jgi:hypothetical protein
MPSCECCYDAFSRKRFFVGGSGSPTYTDSVIEHQERGCECSKNTPEGARLRAGQFWDEERQCDRRSEPAPVRAPEDSVPLDSVNGEEE